MTNDWRHAGIEPAIDEMLADPIVLAVMRRDRIGEQDVRRAMAQARPGATILVAFTPTDASRKPR